MRIVHLSESSIPSQDANALQVMKMCNAFAGLGHEVTLYARPGTVPVDDVYAYYGVEQSFDIVYRKRRGPGRAGKATYGVSVARALRQAGPVDLLYARDPFSLAAAVSAGLPMVFEAHVMPSGWIMKQMQHWLFTRPRFLRLVVITQALADGFRSRVPALSQEKILVVPSGAEVPSSPPPEQDVSNGQLKVGYAGHLYPGKGMEVVAPLAQRLPGMDFHVAGGTEGDLDRWRRDTRGTKNLHFHGHLTPARVEDFRRSMNVMLVPTQAQMSIAGGTTHSSAWTSPLKLFEAMAAARPIVASNLPSFRDVLEDKTHALLVSPDNLDQWVAALQMLEQDPSVRHTMGLAGFELVSRRYSWEQRAQRVLEGL